MVRARCTPFGAITRLSSKQQAGKGVAHPNDWCTLAQTIGAQLIFNMCWVFGDLPGAFASPRWPHKL
jgi:hypothetical protein